MRSSSGRRHNRPSSQPCRATTTLPPTSPLSSARTTRRSLHTHQAEVYLSVQYQINRLQYRREPLMRRPSVPSVSHGREVAGLLTALSLDSQRILVSHLKSNTHREEFLLFHLRILKDNRRLVSKSIFAQNVRYERHRDLVRHYLSPFNCATTLRLPCTTVEDPIRVRSGPSADQAKLGPSADLPSGVVVERCNAARHPSQSRAVCSVTCRLESLQGHSKHLNFIFIQIDHCGHPCQSLPPSGIYLQHQIELSMHGEHYHGG